jgi:hypothetical protein
MSDPQRSVACFLGAGYSLSARVPLAKDLFKANYPLALSQRSERRFLVLCEHYKNWQQQYSSRHSEEYPSALYAETLSAAPPWNWAVEYISAVIASAGTPPGSLNRNPRYSNRVNRPSRCEIHQRFWSVVLGYADDVAVLTTNYDLLIERTLRHRPMRRPFSPGCFYGGIPRPQMLKGAAQPFSVFAPDRLIEMSGAIPIYKLHGSLNWSLSADSLVMYQDARPAFRNGGTAAIVPPVPEKRVVAWLRAVWRESELALQNSKVWIVCGYSAPPYDTEVLRLLRAGSAGRCRQIYILSPDSTSLRQRWSDLVPRANVVALQGLPEGVGELADGLAQII